jgi:hypothetical protein
MPDRPYACDEKFIVFMEAVPSRRDSQPPITAGYYVGHAGQNAYIYGRGPKDRALTFSKWRAVHFILDAKARGYPCRAEPPINLTL